MRTGQPSLNLVFMWQTQKNMKRLLTILFRDLTKENKGKYKVEFVAADTEAHSKNMKLAADGSLPEIVHLDSAEAPKYNEAEYH